MFFLPPVNRIKRRWQYAGFLVLLFIAMVGLLVAFGSDCGTTVRQDIRESMRAMMYYDPDRSGKTGMDFTQQMVNKFYLQINLFLISQSS